MFFKNLDTRSKRVVSPGTNLGKLNIELLHLLIGNLLAFGILPLQQARSHRQPRLGGGSTKVAKHRFEAASGNPRPILAHLAEQTMFNRIPLGAACGVVRDDHSQAITIREVFLQLLFPHARTTAIAASAVS